MEFKANITKKFMFELSSEEANAIETVCDLIETIEDTVVNYEIDSKNLTIDVLDYCGGAIDCIDYYDLTKAKLILDSLKYAKKLCVEENIEEL